VYRVLRRLGCILLHCWSFSHPVDSTGMIVEDKKDEEIPTFVIYPSARFLDRGYRVS
jgi:hypothetical protein